MNQLQTHEYLKAPESYKFHLLSDDELQNIWVSSKSKWADDSWSFDTTTHFRKANIRFNLNGSNVVDDSSRGTINYFKRLAWSLFVDRREGRQLKLTTSSTISSGLFRLLPWAIENNITDMSKMTPDAADDFMFDLLKILTIEDADITEGKIGPSLWLISQIWKQSEVFKGVIPVPSEDPLRGITSNSLESSLAEIGRGWIPPVPDAVANVILSKCVEFIDTDTDNLIDCFKSLLEYDESLLNEQITRRELYKKRYDYALDGIESLPGFYKNLCDVKGDFFRTQPNRNDPAHFIRMAVNDLATACLIIIQAMTGMRASELCSLEGGVSAETNLPNCIEIERSKDGMLDIYYVSGSLIKTLDTPETMRWVAGCTLPKSKRLPLAMRAISILEKIFGFWPTNDGKFLWLNFPSTTAFPRLSDKLGLPRSDNNSRRQQGFNLRHVDFSHLPDFDGEIDLRAYKNSKGGCIRPHQWRKSFAIWLYRYDSRMIAAISEQFKHLSIAMTELGYLGNDPTLLETLDSTRVQETVNFFFEASRGTRKLTGAMSKRIQEHIHEIETLAKNLDSKDAKNAIQNWIKTNDLRIHFAEHGKCMMSLTPKNSKCRQANQTDSWQNTSPNYMTRSPNLCSGCDCFVVDTDHAKFWQHRYSENASIWKKAINLDVREDYIIARSRAVQAKQILKVLDLPIPAISEE